MPFVLLSFTRNIFVGANVLSSVSFQMSHGNKAAVVKSYLATVFTEGSQQKNTHEDGLNVAIH